MTGQGVFCVDGLPYLTTELPGVGGVIKRYNEDFVVEEIPRYPAGGQGTHTYFFIEKQALTTPAAIDRIARALGVASHTIGYAGMKDAHGVTRQWLSLEHVDPHRVQSLEIGHIKVLRVERHSNKLKLGHLAGNCFAIRVRGIGRQALAPSRLILDQLASRGAPNYFGPQRFGARGDNARIGRAVLLNDYDTAVGLILGRPGTADHGDVLKARTLFDAGDLQGCAAAWPGAFVQQKRLCRVLIKARGDARKAWRAVDHTLRKLYLSAFQSELFNRILAQRMPAIGQLETGDLAWKHQNGACFLVEDAAVEQPRCDSLEISPTGPLFGRRMTEARGQPGRREAAMLAESGLSKERLASTESARLEGARRPLRVPIGTPAADAGDDERGPYILLTFTLPPGAYATSVTREICKTEE